MKQISIFAEENRLQKLSELGDCLERLNVVDFERFRPTIALAFEKERKSNAGRPPYDSVMGKACRFGIPAPRKSYEIRVWYAIRHSFFIF